jgi:ABC-type nitrate/sulfonate/bicarbonate transport system substrate-binding protein
MLMRLATSGKRLGIGAVVAALVAAGCGAGATPAPTAAFVLPLQLTPSHVSVAIAADQGYLKGIDLKWQMVGYDVSSQLFQAGTHPIGNESAWEAAVYQDKGKDVRFFSTVEALNFISGIVVRTADKGKYPDLKALKGQKLGQPGFGTGTWAAFQTIAKAQYGLNAKSDFQIVEGNPGDLEGLLQTKAIEAFITFTAPTANALANPDYHMLYNITDEWKKANGHYLTITGWEADSKWLDSHLEIAKSFVTGIQQGLDYYKQNLQLDDKGAKYEAFAQNEGRLDPEVQRIADPWIRDGYYFLNANMYTKAWADSTYKFIQLGDGILLPQGKVPPLEKVFYPPMFY